MWKTSRFSGCGGGEEQTGIRAVCKCAHCPGTHLAEMVPVLVRLPDWIEPWKRKVRGGIGRLGFWRSFHLE
jgi:hypothetical protein